MDECCHDCRFLCAELFSAHPGWKCMKDAADSDKEHDPTDEACREFQPREPKGA
jgi:hypothetical protein